MKPDLAWKFYLTGEMEHLPNFGRDTFDRVEQSLKSAGYDVWSPAGLPLEADDCILLRRERLSRLVECHALILIPGWETSRTVRLEIGVARSLNMPVFGHRRGRLFDITHRMNVRIDVRYADGDE